MRTRSSGPHSTSLMMLRTNLAPLTIANRIPSPSVASVFEGGLDKEEEEEEEEGMAKETSSFNLKPSHGETETVPSRPSASRANCRFLPADIIDGEKSAVYTCHTSVSVNQTAER